MLSALAEKGSVVHKCVLAAPHHGTKKAWLSAMDELGIDFVPVNRRAGGSKDPNDIAIGMEVARLVTTGLVDTIAIAVSDADFLHLAQRLRAWGHKLIAVFPSNSRTALASEFEKSGAEVIWCEANPGRVRLPKMKAVLHSDGESRIEPIDGTDKLDIAVDSHLIEQHLMEWHFLAAEGAPVIPAIAKYYVANEIGPLTVWPPQLPRIQFRSEVLENPLAKAPSENPGDLVFVFPCAMGMTSKANISKYGSLQAGRILSSGGPFMCEDSAYLPEEVLARLGYLDNRYNTDLNEAIDTFAAVTSNRRSLKDLGLDVPPFCSVHSKKAAIHAALTSGKSYGHWQVAPKDSSVRGFLFAHGYISAVDCPVDEVWEGSKSYARKQGIPISSTYNVLVGRILSSQNRQPTKRSE